MCKMQEQQNIVIAMPAFNEEAYIGSMVIKAKKYADTVIVVDDGSNDATAEIAALAGAEVLSHHDNRGKGAAVRTILDRVRELDADLLVLLDSDSQHNADEIPRLIDAVNGGLDFVVGSRQNVKKSIPFYRRIGHVILLHSTRTVIEHELTDTESGFRAFSRKAIEEMKLTQNGFAIESEMVKVAAEKGLKMGEVPITVQYKRDTSTKNPFSHGMEVLTQIIIMISERRPLFFFGMLGIIVTFIGIYFGVRTINIFTATQGTIPIGTVMLAAIFIIVGIFLGLTGIILYALSRRK